MFAAVLHRRRNGRVFASNPDAASKVAAWFDSMRRIAAAIKGPPVTLAAKPPGTWCCATRDRSVTSSMSMKCWRNASISTFDQSVAGSLQPNYETHKAPTTLASAGPTATQRRVRRLLPASSSIGRFGNPAPPTERRPGVFPIRPLSACAPSGRHARWRDGGAHDARPR